IQNIIRHTINKQVACFASALKLSKSIVRSGYNNEQYLADAHEYYKAQKWNKKQASFRLMHCWEILKDQPKWMRESSDAAQPAATSSVTPTTALDTSQETRPLGAKRAKQQQKGMTYNILNYASIMAKMHADLVAALEAKNSIAQRALDTKLFTVVVPDDPEAQLFFAMKRKEAVLRARADLLLAETKGLATPSKRQKH
ncbi:hypothetical protein AaE_003257, partial [Aphanomyces astaci]